MNMELAENLRFLADRLDEQLDLERLNKILKEDNNRLESENDYLRHLLQQLGIDDIWGDFTVRSLSVADVMALEKAIASAKVA